MGFIARSWGSRFSSHLAPEIDSRNSKVRDNVWSSAVELPRGLPSPDVLLRMLMLHVACGCSSPETVVRGGTRLRELLRKGHAPGRINYYRRMACPMNIASGPADRKWSARLLWAEAGPREDVIGASDLHDVGFRFLGPAL